MNSSRTANNSMRSSLAVAFIFFAVATILIMVDRSTTLDNDNYIEYFRGNGFVDQLTWLKDNLTIANVAIGFISEEFIWLFFSSFLSKMFLPETSVYIVSILVNLFVFLGCLKADKPIFAVILWVIIPVGLTTVGYFQLRQGLAFSLFFFGTYYSNPGKFGLLSCGIHTTMIIPYLYYLTDLFFHRFKSWIVAAIFALTLSAAMAVIGGFLFDLFGGRRLATYELGDGAESFNYVISSLLFATFYLSSYKHYYLKKNDAARIFSLAGFGVSSFVTVSFFIFPLGTSRVGYFLMLFALPLLSESGALNIKKYNEPRITLGFLIILFIIYQAIKSFATD